MREHIADAKSKGAQVILGDESGSNDGNFIAPTIVTGATRDMAFSTEETCARVQACAAPGTTGVCLRLQR